MGRPPVGLQCIVLGKTYSITDPAVMDRVAAAGYEAVECGASDPAALKKMLDDRGMKYGGMHLTPQRLGDISPIVDTLGVLESADVCNSGIEKWEEATADDYRATIDILNTAGAKLRKAGVHLHYHNHAFEFKKVDGDKSGMDLLLENLDPSAVDLCVDVGWVNKGGSDPVAFLKEHEPMVGYLHLKDYKGDNWAELGAGEVNVKGVVDIIPELSGVRWVMYEQDKSQIDPLESVEISRTYLKDECGY